MVDWSTTLSDDYAIHLALANSMERI
ncbi:hypothetical protein MIPYR_20455 [uncultured Microbacterium sp.]|uniref:Uncharacterized protein n=1 Tax=uncultured Microbacterium sp. TaxID=191216 RepID=A0A1Y5P4D8_9MICO|nr:hypothetical protein MIPYR_20455 [uncultured Microbacterium sp.]